MTRAQVILLCVLRRALYELGRVGGLCGGSLLAGFPWFYTRGSKVAAELKIIEARVLAIAQAACVTDAQKTFLSDSLAAVWARPLLTDLLLIARLDALTPANDERKMGDYSDTVSTQEIQQLLQLRGLERAQPKGANTMSSGPPPSAPNMEGECVLPLHVCICSVSSLTQRSPTSRQLASSKRARPSRLKSSISSSFRAQNICSRAWS